jgi:hypothetical protein
MKSKVRQMKALERFVLKLVEDTKRLEIQEGLRKETESSYTVTFWKEGRLYLSAEDEYSSLCIADYYGEFRGGYPWINEKIEKRANELGLQLEWENPGSVGVYPA